MRLDWGLTNVKVMVPFCRTVAEGRQVVALIGANGAGKTTTLKAISGVLPAVGGKIRFEGEDITNLAPHKRVRRGMVLPELEAAAFALKTNGLSPIIDGGSGFHLVTVEERRSAGGAVSEPGALGRAWLGPRAEDLGALGEVPVQRLRELDGLVGALVIIVLICALFPDKTRTEEAEEVAELIIAKHRNGPTDTVKLSFLKRYAKFADLAAA